MSAPGETGTSEVVLQLKINLIGASKPPVWRRLLVPATMRLMGEWNWWRPSWPGRSRPRSPARRR